ncbi:OmpA family protein [Sulfuricurvum sp.]|uniref:OmpA family protein n=1 Tax=Sulfuricurvum sp. TaxID=2025608 RepID=UPI0026382058|nr:OmpA family protein [Sulfuricurvum sp.]MDD4950443.1 OmpA family protein [Sulfuricurvum sp.]
MLYQENIKIITKATLVLASLIMLDGCSQSVKGYYIPRPEPMIKEKPIPIIIEAIENAKPLPINVEPIIEEKQVSKQTITLNSVYLFPFGSAQLTTVGKAELLHFTNELKNRNNEIKMLTIHGYTDRLGEKAFNQRLSQKRAQHIADYLKSQGISIPMSVVGKGSSDPVSVECSGRVLINCLASDRRVEIKNI